MTALFPKERKAEFSTLRDTLIRAILKHFSCIYDAFPNTDFLTEYKENSCLIGKDILVYDALTDREKKGKGTQARVIDISHDGGLLVEYTDGKREVLTAGEVTLREA